jgi:hypothetical protein
MIRGLFSLSVMCDECRAPKQGAPVAGPVNNIRNNPLTCLRNGLTGRSFVHRSIFMVWRESDWFVAVSL